MKNLFTILFSFLISIYSIGCDSSNSSTNSSDCPFLNQSRGCDGVCSINPLTYDACGVCGGSAVLSGCDNTCGSTLENDACGVCGGEITNESDCLQIQCDLDVCISIQNVDLSTNILEVWMMNNIPVAGFQSRRGMPEMNMFTQELLDSFESSVVPQPEADTLPAVVYTSEEFLDFEREAIFDHEWLCVGLASRIPDVGDWFTVDVNDERLIITRDKGGEVRALSSVCQHRAQAICEGAGNSTTFKCPYHHWTYGLDGRLLGAPAMERTENFDKKEWGLPSVMAEVWQGFIFVNLDPEARLL